MAGAFPADPSVRYAVRLFFSDYQAVAPGARVFNLTIAGHAALRGFDIAGAGAGVRVGVVRTFLVRPCADLVRGLPAVQRACAFNAVCLLSVCMRATRPGLPSALACARQAAQTCGETG
jgi:hypothetical protein